MKKFLVKMYNALLMPVKLVCSPSLRKMINEDWAILVSGGRTAYYSKQARKVAITCGENLRVNNKCTFGGNISFGNNCNFNGINVLGGSGGG